MRMRKSLADFEAAFYEAAGEEAEHRRRLARHTDRRARRREMDREHRRGTMRFALLFLVLLGTAVLVALGMFQALYLVMG